MVPHLPPPPPLKATNTNVSLQDLLEKGRMLTASGLFFFAQELVPTGASLTPVTTWNQFLGSLREMETVRSSGEYMA